jgi:hypothetical protein
LLLLDFAQFFSRENFEDETQFGIFTALQKEDKKVVLSPPILIVFGLSFQIFFHIESLSLKNTFAMLNCNILCHKCKK